MNIKIGSTLFIGDNSPYHLKSGIQGFDSPAIRTGDGVYAGRDGGFVSGHFYGQRTIVIPGFLIGSDCNDAEQLRTTLLSLMRIRYSMPIIITDFGGNYYYTEGFIKDVKSNITSPVSSDFQLTFLCPDPLLYKLTSPSNVNTRYLSQTFNITTAGTAVTLTINNAGSVDVYPSFSWSSGVIQGFSVENTTTGKTFALDSSMPSGTTIIDFQKRIITVNGVSYSSHRLSTSSWFSLVPGQNELVLNKTGGGGSGSIKWPREAKAGI